MADQGRSVCRPFRSDEGVWLIVRGGYICTATEQEVALSQRIEELDAECNRWAQRWAEQGLGEAEAIRLRHG